MTVSFSQKIFLLDVCEGHGIVSSCSTRESFRGNGCYFSFRQKPIIKRGTVGWYDIFRTIVCFFTSIAWFRASAWKELVGRVARDRMPFECRVFVKNK